MRKGSKKCRVHLCSVTHKTKECGGHKGGIAEEPGTRVWHGCKYVHFLCLIER